MARRYQTTTTTDLSPSQYLMLTSLSMEGMEWKHRFIDNNRIEASRPAGNNVQLVSVTVDGSEVVVDARYDQWVISDFGKNKKAAEELLQAIETQRTAYSPEALDQKMEQLVTESEAAAADLEARFEKGELTTSEKMTLGVGGHYVTYTLIGINILVFVLMVVSGVGLFDPEAEDLIKWGGNLKYYTQGGEWWRLITSVFVHIGVVHLGLNMYALFSVGVYLEPALGRWRFLALYLVSGVFASLTSTWWHENTVSAGASGAIFGLYGVFLALLASKLLDEHIRKSMFTSIAIFVGYNLLYGLKAGVDNAAHIGGLVSGFALGYLYCLLQKSAWQKYFIGAITTIMLITASIFLLANYNHDSRFLRLVDQVAECESIAVTAMQKNDGEADEDYLRKLKTVSLPQWKKADYLMLTANRWKLSDGWLEKRVLLDKYVGLQLEYVTVTIQAMETGEQAKWEEAQALEPRILDLIGRLRQ